MRIDVITIFPDMFPGPLDESILGRALDRGLLQLEVHDLRAHAEPPHYQVDDHPYGGGGGMVLKPEPLFAAVEGVNDELRALEVEAGPVVLLTPQGRRLDHRLAARLARRSQLTLVCGRYEGVDERVRRELSDLEVSIGDYVLTGGELASMVLIDAVVRLQPGALGGEGAASSDSFATGMLDYPQYTRPAEFRGMEVPEILRSGDHEAIRRWRRRQALLATARRRPELLAAIELSDEDRRLLAESAVAGDVRSERGEVDPEEGDPP